MSSSVRRVVITGLGVISPLGNTPEAVWDALASRRSGIHPFTTFDASTLPTSFGGEIAEFSGGIDDFGSVEGDKKKQIRKNLKVMCRETQMGVARLNEPMPTRASRTARSTPSAVAWCLAPTTC
jgi:3-oxoacyl-[acyl-carrier-protein] synthase II